jgi:hypothetical protein
MRQRKREENKEEKIEYMDQDDQEKLIASFRKENEKQNQQIESIFHLLAGLLAVLSIFAAFVVHRREPSSPLSLIILRSTHAALSCLVHYKAVTIIQVPDVNDLSWSIYRPYGFSIVAAAFALYVTRANAARAPENGSIYLHRGLVIANTLILAGAFLLRRERQISEKSLFELQSAKYQYKSL